MTKEALQQMLINNRKQYDFYQRPENRLKRWIDNPVIYRQFLADLRERINYLENELIHYEIRIDS